MNISDEAVEAVADIYAESDDTGSLETARAALEAAAPYIAADALRPALELHNADGLRWVGFPRADRQEPYCTECNKAAPCPTAQLANPYRS